MFRVEGGLDRVAIPSGERNRRQLDRDGVSLPDVAHVGVAGDGDALGFDVGSGQRAAAGGFHLRVKRFERVERGRG